MSREISLFDGHSLTGWFAAPRIYGSVYPGGPELLDLVPAMPREYNEQSAKHPAVWTVEDGAIVGRQDAAPPGWGGYLVSEQTFGSFELELEMKPDWPADTGVMIRRRRDSWEGLQVLVDHRQSGSIGGFYGNGIAGFHGVPFNIAARLDALGRPVGLVEDDPTTTLEPITAPKRAMLAQASAAAPFLESWRWRDWNTLRIRCEGTPPRVTTWVNDVLIAEIDTSAIDWPGYNPEAVWSLLGKRGHIALEVHDNDPGMGAARWGRDAACRWRNLRLQEL
ncbi:3-keto-disaccharide hydrolase [Microbacterium pygmaeum]|uniref:3-keto-alpha-glucoside-1,2-lyase/3-keto-2-hydroxy-glucal hydratase domain-containing protein n=1 Tax=Microbacterium pygmaeum TaxID=370764 RepID=A0A1G7X999_9MICO|nr:DUF1080 domain-containing protein [Microbacterium pygmaeum]SDG80716.1 protein of unknown function [Microbacterium pygmaeum]